MNEKLDETTIRCAERAHYYMQMSAYFTKLQDGAGARFAFTSRLSDTWYNQAYDIDWTDRPIDDLVPFVSEVCQSEHRAPCIYLSPASRPVGIESVLESNGWAKFEDEAWMFYDLTGPSDESDVDLRVSIKTVDIADFDDFEFVYRNGLPGPDVEQYVESVRAGLRYTPPGIETRYFLAYCDTTPVGMLSLLSFGEMSGIYAVATLDAYRGKGVARQLVRHARHHAQRRNSRHLFLQTVAGEESEEAFSHIGFETKFVRAGFTTAALVDELEHG